MKAKTSQDLAKVAPPYNYANQPTRSPVKSLSKGPTLKVNQRNTVIENDELEDKVVTKLNYAPGFDEPLTDGVRNFKSLKGFKQAKLMTVEMTGFSNNPVRQDIDEAYGKFVGQEQQ
jgi:hypothetical protein